MPNELEVVITGLGVVSPIGIGLDAYWASMRERRSGVRPFSLLQGTEMPVRFGGEIADFDAKQYVTPRKSLKVMSREIQTGFAAASFAMEHAGLGPQAIDPDRFGVVYGCEMLYGPLDELMDAYQRCKVDGTMNPQLWADHFMTNIYPLWMLKYLPNMTACHVGIAHDARGPNNTISHGEVSSLLAMIEATHVLQRGQADVMIVGGCGSRLNLVPILYRSDSNLSHREHDPTRASRPFDAQRDGLVNGEGAAAFILETRDHAERRGATVWATIRGSGNSYEADLPSQPANGAAIRRSIAQALAESQLEARDIGHVNAHGVSTVAGDQREAQAIRDCLGEVPVTAPKSFFGHLGAGSGAVEMLASILAMHYDEVPITLNYETPDPACPVNVIHDQPLTHARPIAMILNQAGPGQAAALVLSRDNT